MYVKVLSSFSKKCGVFKSGLYSRPGYNGTTTVECQNSKFKVVKFIYCLDKKYMIHTVVHSVRFKQ